ncbi:hypothetical protein D3C80_1808670 [compost metagenome]
MNGVLRIARNALDQIFRQHLAVRSLDGNHAHAGEEIRRSTFILDHMRFGMTEGQAAGAGNACQRKRIGRRTCSDEKHRHFAFEYFIEALFYRKVEGAGAIGSRKSGGFPRKALVDGRVGTGPNV